MKTESVSEDLRKKSMSKVWISWENDVSIILFVQILHFLASDFTFVKPKHGEDDLCHGKIFDTKDMIKTWLNVMIGCTVDELQFVIVIHKCNVINEKCN